MAGRGSGRRGTIEGEGETEGNNPVLTSIAQLLERLVDQTNPGNGQPIGRIVGLEDPHERRSFFNRQVALQQVVYSLEFSSWGIRWKSEDGMQSVVGLFSEIFSRYIPCEKSAGVFVSITGKPAVSYSEIYQQVIFENSKAMLPEISR
ncbi:pentatricopeptide repeat-containing protein [Dorcoceras hygrometricum]|uniref:Pentatricopeptide repeat-containing protein n=1 Tax=Dorcoceras hygrometricum TaxID=472368 RepID=A0A2Z7AHS7_9LAMI|nr:pentatricopeptide repeat-containing protein [Dorcoceras hygrometricum]